MVVGIDCEETELTGYYDASNFRGLGLLECKGMEF
jgi:hypothetical protein